MLTHILFLLFVLSGFCGLLYQIVWLRLAFGAFGIVTPVLSVTVSVFMLGLAVGSWGAGRAAAAWQRVTRLSPIYLYAIAEAIVGVSALLVPAAFDAGHQWLLREGQIDSFRYLAMSAIFLSVPMLPACIAMGATFPLMLAHIGASGGNDGHRFSFLYLGNVLGASLGAAITALVLIETFGFRRTLVVAAVINFAIALVSVWLGARGRGEISAQPASNIGVATRVSTQQDSALFALTVLFLTGFASLALEVTWTRAFTPVMGAYVYSFAGLLFAYLWATWMGSWVYRRHLARGAVLDTSTLLGLVAVTSVLPIVLTDARLHWHRVAVTLVSISPFCAVLGYLTPRLIDQYSADEPTRAGRAYAVNVVGCILGPLVAGYVLLPLLGARLSMVALSAPFLILFLAVCRPLPRKMAPVMTGAVSGLLLVFSTFVTASWDDGPPGVPSEVRRDHTATVVSFGEDPKKGLWVNGIGITAQTPLTKLMAHLPLALHNRARSVAVICFGMGTTYRSALSWDVETTAVDLSRSVPEAFPYYFSDAPQLMRHPKGRIVIDDGRRFLQRQREPFDIITLDPPPPLEAAGSSLLYSKEFYELAKTRLAPGGILQQWNPAGDPLIVNAIARSLVESFDYVVAFRAIEGGGVHYSASMSPIAVPAAAELVARFPQRARSDAVEWNEGELRDLETFMGRVLARQVPIETLLNPDRRIVITDDRPYNEYYMLRRRLYRASE